ncbi:hypothetical protein Y032_0329g2665 [Ancylostoma ceylanicum]|uniref:Uncharacterized protein n=1 Tax=Ancylostoma ceylanicum TaxID=53326 RepID=A0A016S0J8_9BILA|nr:hypothetical protein Y032_0329g2665 [Ancylostoma ceylanicum]
MRNSTTISQWNNESCRGWDINDMVTFTTALCDMVTITTALRDKPESIQKPISTVYFRRDTLYLQSLKTLSFQGNSK